MEQKRTWAVGALLVASAWMSAAHAGACVGNKPHPCPPAASAMAAASAAPQAVRPAAARGIVIAPVGSTPLGQSYGRWAAQWYQWALGIPAANNPMLDEDGRFCAERQVDDVWFLAGWSGAGTAVRHCTVPADKALFFPLINNALGAFLNDPPEQRTEAFLREVAACKGATVAAWIDGAPVPKPTKYFTGPGGSPSPLFNVQLPPGNLWGATPESVPELVFSPTAEQGYYLFLYPLPPGDHQIHWVATGCSEGNVQDITYYLKIQ